TWLEAGRGTGVAGGSHLSRPAAMRSYAARRRPELAVAASAFALARDGVTQNRTYTARRTTAARPKSTVPTAKSFAPSGTGWSDDDSGTGRYTEWTTGALP